MKTGKIVSASLVFLFLASVALTVPFAVKAGNAPATVYYSYYTTSLTSVSGGMGGGFGAKLSAPSLVHYVVVQVNGTTNTSGKKVSIQATEHVYDYLLISKGAKSVSGDLAVTSKGNWLFVSSDVPYLAEVVVKTAGKAYLAWAGLTNGSASFQVPAYINGSAEVDFVFLNGSSYYVVSTTVKEGGSATVQVTAQLQDLVVHSFKAVTKTKTIVADEPRRYAPYRYNVEANGTVYSGAEGYAVTKAYWKGTLVPAIVWRSNGHVQHEVVSFYGVNGTLVGYVYIFYLNVTVGGSHAKHTSTVSMLVIVDLHGEFVKPEYEGTAFVRGQPAVIIVGKNGSVESTANVTLSHEVYVEGRHGAIVWVEVNGTQSVVVVFKGNTTANVTVVKPKSVNVTAVNYAGATHKATEVMVQKVSGVMTFNVTANGTVVAVLKKLPNGSLAEVNSSSYFMANGKVIVVDDPTTTYYVVYDQTVTTTTTTSTTTSTTSMTTTTTSTTTSTTTATTTTTTSTQSTSTTTTTTTTSATTTQTTSPATTTSTASTSSTVSPAQSTQGPAQQGMSDGAVLAAAAVIIIVVIAAAVLFMRRK
ncbi:MAG: hypothetical protein ACP5HQ_03010 [Thermoprotei archaeon]